MLIASNQAHGENEAERTSCQGKLSCQTLGIFPEANEPQFACYSLARRPKAFVDFSLHAAGAIQELHALDFFWPERLCSQ